MDTKSDVVIVGGGLAGCFAAMKLKTAKPELHVVIIEETDKLGGHHTWSFHDSDFSPESLEWLGPVIERTWESTEVRFPKLQKTISSRLSAIRSDTVHRHMKDLLGDDIVLK